MFSPDEVCDLVHIDPARVANSLKPLYNFMDALPNLEGEPPPILPPQHLVRTSGSLSSICCSYCRRA